MATRLKGKKIAILATDGFEQVELTDPQRALQEVGAEIDIVSPDGKPIRGWDHTDWGQKIPADKRLGDVKAADYDGLFLPGGVLNPDQLRQNKKAVQFVQDFFEQQKPVAAICHGPQMLIEADVVEGRKLTSYSSVRTDLENAGANWVDESVVVDRGLITSRNPGDLGKFIPKMIDGFAEGLQRQRGAQ